MLSREPPPNAMRAVPAERSSPAEQRHNAALRDVVRRRGRRVLGLRLVTLTPPATAVVGWLWWLVVTSSPHAGVAPFGSAVLLLLLAVVAAASAGRSLAVWCRQHWPLPLDHTPVGDCSPPPIAWCAQDRWVCRCRAVWRWRIMDVTVTSDGEIEWSGGWLLDGTLRERITSRR